MTDAESAPAEEVVLPPLELHDPLPDVVEDADSLQRTLEALRHGTGPVAIDAERASGYRYSQRAYLIQLRREGSGTALVDPTAFDDLSPLDDVIAPAEWILHAATQDLPSLAEVGLRPRSLFDTELAGRLLNLPRVGLASLVQEVFGLSLAKEHSAADWSRRPLPEPWLLYAALDVEPLVGLRDALETRLEEAGKLEWAHEEFEALLAFAGPAVRSEPWRRTSGIHKVRGGRRLAVVRALWEARDAIARERDVTPGRILNDAAIVTIARSVPRTRQELRDLEVMRSRGARRYLDTWDTAVSQARDLDERELPTASGNDSDGPPPPRSWPERKPEAAARLAAYRTVLAEIAERHDVPSENLLTPDAVRRLAWDDVGGGDPDAIAAFLREKGARSWQIGLTASALAEARRALDV
ncbi:ribonuclease D [Mumia zhuanghuii]|uniref:Ribonuclease D n=1 Tax=Mumia zhuanghuii TaxID=2585211 RepID=A0A5C4MNG5_9ACTN|nr:ribonuclease D [Mumia zhuanghuii]TNC30535.1 ribonuclease D [Mumia zhuanghuii]TNC45022.1 ribonuclease D [Mumia zhuanghuii]